ncbi:hypothetical protein LTR84_010755 [Exophiala bonariae]|uniref:BZIP domain-containing protein n=1 Tax=Exophiala bonariae TaxID=1690606 RepID=A0AAV9MS91_9EURO|nr:hypothetical protein LTR84_010755 [Exophiala bonariae]
MDPPVVSSPPPSKHARARTVKEPENARRVRKREMDRKAQQTFREKTRNYITHLEQTVEVFKARCETDVVEKLLIKNSELQRTNGRLRKVLKDLVSTLQAELQPEFSIASGFAGGISSDKPGGSQCLTSDLTISSTDNFDAQGDSDEVIVGGLPAAEGFLENGGDKEPLINESAPDIDIISTLGGLSEHVPASERNQNLALINDNLPFTYNAGMTFCEQDMNVQAFAMQCSSEGPCSFDMQYPTPLRYFGPFSVLPPSEGSDIWCTTSLVFNKIFDISSARAERAKTLDKGVIFRAIQNGWNTLDPYILQHPIIEILRDYDQLVAERLDKVNRVAIAYKNSALFKVRVIGSMS